MCISERLSNRPALGDAPEAVSLTWMVLPSGRLSKPRPTARPPGQLERAAWLSWCIPRNAQ